jgi:LacI family transcriptional regulator
MASASSKDVARQAGVSIATVSHVINGTRFVSDETRQKVMDAIGALNYRPNAIARGLVTQSTRKIGLVISEITNPFFTAVARGIEDETISHRHNIILCNTDEDPEREEDRLHLLATQRIDGLIIAPTGVRCASLLAMAESGVPIVQLDRRSPGLEAPFVGVNNEEGAYQAISYLIGLGHRRIACLINLDVISTQAERCKGWERALREAGLPVDNDLIVRADPRFYGVLPGEAGSWSLVRPVDHRQKMPSAYEVLQGLLNLPQHPSAIFVASNQLTLGTLYAFRAVGLRCPEDVSLISFDDHDWAPLFSPPLTIVRQPTYRLGQTAVQLLMQMINGESVEDPPPLQVELVVRASCGPPPVGGSSQLAGRV